jgi:ABC-2 type transport system ATP-binding protein
VTAAVRAEGLVKKYGSVIALNGLSLHVEAGTVLGLLGPNGAGKTTAVRVLTTLLDADEGMAEVVGFDVRRSPTEVRKRIGLSGQYAAVDEYLTGRENLELVGRLYHLGKSASRLRAGELLERFDLVDAADRIAKTYSGGMRRRLDLAASLVASPPVMFLDEPTTGLDPRSRMGMWEVIASLVRDGTTVLLTTQYLEEADRLADTIAVVDHGRVIASGTADELKSQVGGDRLDLVVTSRSSLDTAIAVLTGICGVAPTVDAHSRRLLGPVAGGAVTLIDAIRQLDEAGVGIDDLALRRPSLDDVFLSLTGHASEEEKARPPSRRQRRAARSAS